jgi:glycosyltransferase involved in cell wall biosynthesis
VASQTGVSIVLPVRNGAKFLEGSMKSISGFARECDEIVAIDDGSSDLTLKILENWSTSDTRVRVIQSEGIGLAGSLNLALSIAKHDWIARADVDDTYSNERLTEQIKLIGLNVVAIFSDYNIVSAKGHSYGRIPTAVFPFAVKLSLIDGSRTPHPVVLLNRVAAISAGGYLGSQFPAEDLGLWVRMKDFGSLVSSPAPLLNYLVNADSVTSTKRSASIAKKADVLNGFRLTETDVGDFAQEFEDCIKGYKKLPYGYERIILFYKDIFKYNRKFEWIFPMKKIWSPVLINPRMIIAALRLLKGFALRRLMRFVSKKRF